MKEKFPLFDFDSYKIIEHEKNEISDLPSKLEYLEYALKEYNNLLPIIADKRFNLFYTKPIFEETIKNEIAFIKKKLNGFGMKEKFPLFDFDFDKIKEYAESKLSDLGSKIEYLKNVLREYTTRPASGVEGELAPLLSNISAFAGRIRNEINFYVNQYNRDFLTERPYYPTQNKRPERTLNQENQKQTKPEIDNTAKKTKLFWNKDIDDLVFLFYMLIKFGFIEEREHYAAFIYVYFKWRNRPTDRKKETNRLAKAKEDFKNLLKEPSEDIKNFFNEGLKTHYEKE